MAIGKHIEILQSEGKYDPPKDGLNGGYPRIAMDFLLNNKAKYAALYTSGETSFSDNYESYNDVTNDFSNSKKVFTFSIPRQNQNENNKIPTFAIENTQTGELDNLFYNHAYSIVGSDENYVYFKNPHDTSITYKCDRKLFAQHNTNIQMSRFNP